MVSKTERTTDSKNRRMGTNSFSVIIDTKVVDGVIVSVVEDVRFCSHLYDLDSGAKGAYKNETLDIPRSIELGIITQEGLETTIDTIMNGYRGIDYVNDNPAEAEDGEGV